MTSLFAVLNGLLLLLCSFSPLSPPPICPGPLPFDPLLTPWPLTPAGPFFPPFTPCPFELPPPVVPFWPLTDPCWPLPVELTPPAWPLAFDPMPPAWPLTLDPVLPAELFALLYEEANAVLLVGLGLRLRPARNQRDNVKTENIYQLINMWCVTNRIHTHIKQTCSMTCYAQNNQKITFCTQLTLILYTLAQISLLITITTIIHKECFDRLIITFLLILLDKCP